MSSNQNKPSKNGHEYDLDHGTLGQIRAAMASAERVLILTHANPDADAVSSALAVADALHETGKSAVPVLSDGTLPDDLAFLPGRERLVGPEKLDISDYQLVIVVDCADITRLGRAFADRGAWFDGRVPVINIDHHITNTHFGQINLIDAESAATCEILAVMFELMGWPMSTDVATCLLSGIFGDTLGLRTPSTTSKTLRVTADVLDHGADMMTVVDNLFRMKRFSTVKLWGEVLSQVQQTGDVVWSEITPTMLERSGAIPSEGEGVVNFIAGTKGAQVGILFYQQPDAWRVSLRSITDTVDVAALAQIFGGGGHSRAAGCTLPPGEEARSKFLAEIVSRVSRLVTEAPGA